MSDDIPETRQEVVDKLRRCWENEILGVIDFVGFGRVLLSLGVLVLIAVPLCLNFIGVPTNDSKVWLSFWGSYIGGLLTLCAIIYTIIARQREVENLKIQMDIANTEKLMTLLGAAQEQLCMVISLIYPNPSGVNPIGKITAAHINVLKCYSMIKSSALQRNIFAAMKLFERLNANNKVVDDTTSYDEAIYNEIEQAISSLMSDLVNLPKKLR